MKRKRRRRSRRDPQSTCDQIYDASLQLHNRVAEEFGGISIPKSGVVVRDVYRAWMSVADAWEVAEDACLEEGRLQAAGQARSIGQRILDTLQAEHRVRHTPSSPHVAAVRELKVAQRGEARYGLDDGLVRQHYLSAARTFDEAGEPRRAAAIRRYLRMKRWADFR